MKPTVYIETTIISYLTALPSRDLIIAGHQQVTHEWWQTTRHDLAVVSSQLVVREAGAGDPAAAQERLTLLGELTLLEITEEALALAQPSAVSDSGQLPRRCLACRRGGSKWH